MHNLASHDSAATERFDMYRLIHKALRAFMGDTLVAVGRMDADDDGDVAVTLEQARGLLSVLAVHLDDENRFVHTAMNARCPGSAERTAADHVEHEVALAEIERLIADVEGRRGSARAAGGLALYRRLGVFVAENYEHMDVEERDNNAVLWAHYTDEELHAIEAQILAAVPPASMAAAMRWMMPSLNHAERVAMLGGMRRGAPEAVYEGVLAIARGNLSARDWAKLESALPSPAARAA